MFLRRLLYILCFLCSGIALLAFLVVLAFNALWSQPSPNIFLLALAEHELERAGLPKCADPEEAELEFVLPQRHSCRWWRIPYKNGEYCGYFRELTKLDARCVEYAFERNTPEEVLAAFRKTFEQPCTVLEANQNIGTFATFNSALRCDNGEQYRRFTVHSIFVQKFLDDETNLLIKDFGTVENTNTIMKKR